MRWIDLKTVRKKQKLSQWALAKKSGVSRNRISMFECGYLENIRDEESRKIEKILRQLPKTHSGEAIK